MPPRHVIARGFADTSRALAVVVKLEVEGVCLQLDRRDHARDFHSFERKPVRPRPPMLQPGRRKRGRLILRTLSSNGMLRAENMRN
jgi:hypothetical protein